MRYKIVTITALYVIFMVRTALASAVPFRAIYTNTNDHKRSFVVASITPGDPMLSGTVFQGVANAAGIFQNLILARVALSFFPQIRKQFPFLRPIFTVTSPYLKVFRRNIPPVGGFDVSAIPAVFVLDLFSKATIALGQPLPDISGVAALATREPTREKTK